MGLYTQREQGYDGTWTGDENTDMLEAKYFMMRVRCDGGALTDGRAAHARRDLDRVRPRHRRHQRPRERPVPLDPRSRTSRRSGSGSTPSACRPPRRAATAPAWCSARRWQASRSTRCSTRPGLLTKSSSRYIGNPEFSNLPRKFKTAISGLQDVAHEVNDVAFIGVNHPEHGPGLDLWVGGGLSTNPMLAQRVGAWVPLEEVPDVWEGVTSVFRDYGYRRLRSKARLKFLIKDWGIEKFREVLETGIPRAQADRRPSARARQASDRPRRRAEAEERPERRRRRADRGPGVRHHPDEGRRPRRGRGLGPHPLHALPEAGHPRRSRRQARRAGRGPGRAGAAVATVARGART